MISADYIIVGAGLAGATIARALQDAGQEVAIIERRDIVSGNCADAIHPSGQRYSLYGPHSFRTNSEVLWDYVRQFGEFIKFEPCVRTRVNGRDEDWPITREYIIRHAPYKGELRETATNFREECLKHIPEEVYNEFIDGYNRKMWDVDPESLSSELARRFSVREGNDRRLMQHKYQGVPKEGYTKWIEKMIEGIPVFTGIDYLENQHEIRHKKKLIYTGAIDALFRYDLGRLKYRGQQRKETMVKTDKNVLLTFQTNFPNPKVRALRVVEWRQMWPSNTGYSLLTTEFPGGDGLEYPFPDKEFKTLYERYVARLPDNVIPAGRLGLGKYFDMDQAISNSLMIAKRILE